MTLEETLQFRRSVRYFDAEKELDTEKVKHCIEMATLAPTSSNMQLWEFYHVTDPETMKKLSHACLDQRATETAKQLVVFVTRRDLHRKRAKAVLAFEKGNIVRYSPKERQETRWKNRVRYYNGVMPFIYSRFFFLLGWFRKAIALTISLFRPMVTNVSESDMRVVVHKTWSKFYWTERILPQLQLALDNRLLAKNEIPREEKAVKLFDAVFGTVQPSLLHGDLWSGNYLIASGGTPYLIDPATYYGHSMVDIAMSRLFGGFGQSFYDAYHEIMPKTEKYDEQIELYQLYYLLVHLNLFGRGYYEKVSAILRHFG